MRFHRLGALLVFIYVLTASLTSCVPFQPRTLSYRPLTTEEIQHVVREHNFDVLATETIGESTVILHDLGGRAGYYAGTVVSDGSMPSIQAQGGGGPPKDIEVIGTQTGTPPFLCVALLDAPLAQQATTVEIIFADGTSTQAPVDGARGVIVPNERSAVWRTIRVYDAAGQELSQMTLPQ